MEEGKVVVGDTTYGKTLTVARDRVNNLWFVQYTSGGEIPESLRGGWNDLNLVKTKCLQYLETLKSKKRYNVKSDCNEAV